MLLQLHIFSFKWKQVRSLKGEDFKDLRRFLKYFLFLRLINSETFACNLKRYLSCWGIRNSWSYQQQSDHTTTRLPHSPAMHHTASSGRQPVRIRHITVDNSCQKHENWDYSLRSTWEVFLARPCPTLEPLPGIHQASSVQSNTALHTGQENGYFNTALYLTHVTF